MEKLLLKLLLKREAFNRFSSLVDLKELKEAHRELSFLYNVVYKFHEENNEHNLTVDELSALFWSAFPDASHDLYDGLLEDIRRLDVSDAVGENILEGMARKKALLSLSEAAYELSQGRGSLEGFQKLTQALDKPAVAAEDFQAVDMDLEHLINKVVNVPGLRWRLDCLNKSLGSLRKGNFGFVFARPETGKTTFLASEISNMLDQADHPIIWFNNEQVGEEVGLRVYQGYFGVTLDVLKANWKQYQKLFKERVGDKFILVDDAGIDCRRIERILERVKPSLIVYDQIDKIKGFKADRDDLVYGAIYQWAREIAKTYAPTIGICQADGSGEGQKWLTMSNVANAKTSKQAEADFILGIGKTNEEATAYLRYFSLCKNKLMGDEDSIGSLRHGRFETLIQPEVARFKDIMKYGAS